MLPITKVSNTDLVDLNGTDSLSTLYLQYKSECEVRVTPSAIGVRQGRDYIWLENQKKQEGLH